jgi:hypothetical protein
LWRSDLAEPSGEVVVVHHAAGMSSIQLAHFANRARGISGGMDEPLGLTKSA